MTKKIRERRALRAEWAREEFLRAWSRWAQAKALNAHGWCTNATYGCDPAEWLARNHEPAL
jgi:hypothetical protein